jgi:hypothetical protein
MIWVMLLENMEYAKKVYIVAMTTSSRKRINNSIRVLDSTTGIKVYIIIFFTVIAKRNLRINPLDVGNQVG